MNWLRIQFLLTIVLLCTGVQAKEVELRFKEASWFPNEVATAFVFIDSEESPEFTLPEDNEDIRFYSGIVQALDKDNRGNHVAIVEFVPKRAGVRTFPALMLSTASTSWETKSTQFIVSELLRSEAMMLRVTPSKTTVYTGEPVRLDFVWDCSLPVAQLRGFRLFPQFLNDPAIKAVVPRSQVNSDLQFGLPVGGRRVIAHRIQDEKERPGQLGEIRFSIWIRIEEAGHYNFPDTRLSCSLLESKGYGAHQYASYFNNSLFEPVDRSQVYQKLFTESGAFEIEVRPLPSAGRLESFSGLFSPNAIELSVDPKELELGQLMKVRVDVKSDTCSEMLELPSLSLQSSLRHRFWVASEQGERWQADGRSFVARARPLTTESQFFPSLSFQVFNAETGVFEMIETKSIPLQVSSKEGDSVFSVENLPGARRLVESNFQGIWHNEKQNSMNDLGHAVVGFLADGAWAFLLLGPLAFVVLNPWVRELRKRSTDVLYARRLKAYRTFCNKKNQAEDAVELIRNLVAGCFERSSDTLTAADAGELLSRAGCDAKLAREVELLLRESDERFFSGRDRGGVKRDTGTIQQLGKQVYEAVRKSTIAIGFLFCWAAFSPDLDANPWQDAESKFTEALALAESGAYSSEIEEAFAEAALSFESCAQAGISRGSSWRNAGNAWFKAGELGRAIAAFRRALAYNSFDQKLRESLGAARSLRVDTYSVSEETARAWPTRWMFALFSVAWMSGWGMLLLWRRFRTRSWLALAFLCGALGVAVGGTALRIHFSEQSEGVLVAEEAYGRKGPGFAYQSAFLEPLHNGTEFSIVERREGWLRVTLANDAECWIPAAVVVEL